MLGIAADVETRKTLTKPKRKCKFARLIESLDVEDELALKFAVEQHDADVEADRPLADRIFTGQWITDTLVNNGHPIGSTAVRDHLARKCICDRSE